MKSGIRFITSMTALLFLFLGCSSGTGQNNEYVKNFDWMVNMFKENDAGYDYYLKEKGADDFKSHTETYRNKIEQAKTEGEFLSIMNEWLFHFRKRHIGVFPVLNPADSEKDSIRDLYSNEARTKWSEPDFNRYLEQNKESLHPIEGIWTSRNYTLGISRSDHNPNEFEAFILKADSVYWTPGQIRAELTERENGTFDVSMSNWNHTKEKTTAKYIGSSKAIISLNRVYWIKTVPQPSYAQKETFFLEYISGKPFIKQIGKNTIYLRIPSFMADQKEPIDRLLTEYDKLIKSTPYLIIDIRNGTGGSDFSHTGLIPYYYTQPIRSIGQTYRGSELNAKAYENYTKLSNDTTGNSRLMSIARKLRENAGGYYDPVPEVVLINSYAPTKYPEKIAVICNKNNASADESFLYMARQSHKVKIFGEPTAGAIDFSNINTIDFPNGKYVLWLTMTASKRIPRYRLDDIGIQPDIYIDNTIVEEDWVEFVQSVIESGSSTSNK